MSTDQSTPDMEKADVEASNPDSSSHTGFPIAIDDKLIQNVFCQQAQYQQSMMSLIT